MAETPVIYVIYEEVIKNTCVQVKNCYHWHNMKAERP